MHLINTLALRGIDTVRKSATLLSVVKRDKTKVDGGGEKLITQAALAIGPVKKILLLCSVCVRVSASARQN